MIHYADSEHDLGPSPVIGYGKRGPIRLVQGGSEPASETPPGDTPPAPATPPVTPPATPPPAPTLAPTTPSTPDGLGERIDALPERIVSGLREAIPHLATPPAPATPPVVVKRTFAERWFGLPAGGGKS